MRKALAIALPSCRAPGLPWALLLAELSAFLLLVAGDRVPLPLFAALRVFLRF